MTCVIPGEQYGFLPKRSTLRQILSVVDDWERAIDAGSTIHACFLDVTMGFDRVDHTLLEHTLSTVGVHAKELSWFVSYLSQRSICSSIDLATSHHLSQSRQALPKVPLILGPLLFVQYSRDIPSAVSSTCALFTDDTLLDDRCSGVSIDLPCCRLEEDVRSLYAWAGDWCTTFEASKSAYMFISSKHRQSGDEACSSLSLSGGIIPVVRTTANLGVRISSTLSWSDHVNNIIARVKFNAFFLKCLAYHPRSADLVKRLYCRLVPVLCLNMLSLFGMHAPNTTLLPWSASSCRQLELIFTSTVIRCTSSMCWPPSAGQLWPGIAVAENCLCYGTFCTAVVLPLCAAKFLLLCLLVVLTVQVPQPFAAISPVLSYFLSLKVFSSFFCCFL